MEGFAVGEGSCSEERRFALRLEHLQVERSLKRDAVDRDAAAFVMALDGHTDARFVLQLAATPSGGSNAQGSLAVHLIVTVRGEQDLPPKSDRIDELCDDLLDVLSVPPLRWGFEPVTDAVELQSLVMPLEPNHTAEIARREEPCSPISWTARPGFTNDVSGRNFDRSLWSMWTLGPAAADLKRLSSVLLAQEAPVCVRVVLHPTSLTDDERSGIEQLVMAASGVVPDVGVLRASLSTLEALLYLRPVFETRCLVASPDPISRSLLSALGDTVSEPARHGQLPTGHLEGGFAVIRGGLDVEPSVLREAYESMVLGEPVPSLAPAGLERLRRLLGAWEASNVFRLPVTDDAFPGITSLSTPDLGPPALGLPEDGRRLGRLVSHGRRPVTLGSEERFRHLYLSGQTGTGKSTLLLNLALQDIAAGAGVAVIDPHGDLVEAIMRNVPDERLDDVVLVDPADPVAVVGVNLLEAETPVQKAYVVSELSNMFTDLFDPNRVGIVGPRFETMLRQAALLLLARPDQPSSMLDISTLFSDKAVRSYMTESITDPVLAEFWLGEMQMSRSNEWQEVVSWFRSKFEIFRTSAMVRSVVGQAESTVSFGDVMNEQRILLVNLSKGMLGEYNSALIGHIVFTRLWAAALERASMPVSKRKDFFVYVDEFQNMTSDSLPDVLSEARKFRVGMTLANQFFSQVPEHTRDAIMGNVGNRVTFRVGPKDALLFADWLGGDVDAQDLTTLPNFIGVASLSDEGIPLDPLLVRTDAPNDSDDIERSERARATSRARWARPIEMADRDFVTRWRHVPDSMASKTNLEPAEPEPGSFLDEWLARRNP